MASRVIVRKKKVKANFDILKSQNVVDQFVRMIGVKQNKVSITVSYEKYLQYKTHITKIVRILEILSNHPALHSDTKAVVLAFLIKIKLDRIFSFHTEKISELELRAGMANYEKLSPEELDDFYKCYERLIESDLIKFIIISFKNLIQYETEITAMDGKFLESAGNLFVPFPTLPVNFKQLYSESNPVGKTMILQTLAKLYLYCNKVYELYVSPNYDMSDIVDFMTKNIELIRKEIKGCDKAFDEILKSVHLLKSNYKTYFREYKQTHNPIAMIESYIKDVYSKVKSDMELGKQFRTIILFFRKKMNESGKSNDPKLAELFSHINMDDDAISEVGLFSTSEEEVINAEP